MSIQLLCKSKISKTSKIYIKYYEMVQSYFTMYVCVYVCSSIWALIGITGTGTAILKKFEPKENEYQK